MTRARARVTKALTAERRARPRPRADNGRRPGPRRDLALSCWGRGASREPAESGTHSPVISCRVSSRPSRGATLARQLAGTALTVLVLSAGACSKKTDDGATTLPRATTTTSTTSLAERYAVPDTITPEYVNDVLAALNHVYGDVVRKRVATQQLSPEDLLPLRAIYLESEFARQSEALAKSPFGSPQDYRSPTGDRRVVVGELLAASPACISAEGTYDFSEVATQPPPPRPVWVTLRPKEAGTDPQRLNPTPWAIAAEELEEHNRCGG